MLIGKLSNISFDILKGTHTLGLLIQPSDCLPLIAYSNANWTVSIDDCKTNIAYCVFHGDSLMSWSSKI